jgi:ubiquinone/menaquinone biosynthesis C-methylase UbiE
MIEITPEESLLLQGVSTVALIGELSNANFLAADYFKNLPFSDDQFKNVLIQSGIGNPATMQMMLYMLLVVPTGMLSIPEYAKLETHLNKINPFIGNLVESTTSSNYKDENTRSKIDYVRHIRNAVSHSSCVYETISGQCFVTFKDRNKKTKEYCSIKITCANVGNSLTKLQYYIMEYLVSRHS